MTLSNSMNEQMLTTNNLKKSFGDFAAVKGISFNIGRGEIFSLLGPNGAGKTTTISMLSCLLTPTDGDAQIDGNSVTKQAHQVKQVIGVVPQELALYQTLSARQNLNFWGRMYDMSGKELNSRVDEMLERVELADRANDAVSTFSGGMKRRLNIAVGLLHRPKLVFMDEPTVGIDPQSRRRILDMVKELQGEGMTVLYTTHYMEEAEELSNRVGIIDKGELIALGSQDELKQTVGESETLRLHLDEGVFADEVVKVMEKVDGVQTGSVGDNQIVLSVDKATDRLPSIMKIANDQHVRVRSIDIEEPNLEAVFLHLTGRALRD